MNAIKKIKKILVEKAKLERMNDEGLYISMFDRIVILGVLPQPQDPIMTEEMIPLIVSLSTKLQPTATEIKEFNFGLDQNKFLTMDDKGFEPLFNPCLTDDEKDVIKTGILHSIELHPEDEQMINTLNALLAKIYS